MQLLTRQKETHRFRGWTYSGPGEGWREGIVREFGMDIYTLLYLEWITDKDCIAPGILLHVTWQPGWEGSLGENAYMYMYGWIPLLSTWNYHNIVSWLYSNIRQKVKKKSVFPTQPPLWGTGAWISWETISQCRKDCSVIIPEGQGSWDIYHLSHQPLVEGCFWGVLIFQPFRLWAWPRGFQRLECFLARPSCRFDSWKSSRQVLWGNGQMPTASTHHL